MNPRPAVLETDILPAELYPYFLYDFPAPSKLYTASSILFLSFPWSSPRPISKPVSSTCCQLTPCPITSSSSRGLTKLFAYGNYSILRGASRLDVQLTLPNLATRLWLLVAKPVYSGSSMSRSSRTKDGSLKYPSPAPIGTETVSRRFETQLGVPLYGRQPPWGTSPGPRMR